VPCDKYGHSSALLEFFREPYNKIVDEAKPLYDRSYLRRLGIKNLGVFDNNIGITFDFYLVKSVIDDLDKDLNEQMIGLDNSFAEFKKKISEIEYPPILMLENYLYHFGTRHYYMKLPKTVQSAMNFASVDLDYLNNTLGVIIRVQEREALQHR